LRSEAALLILGAVKGNELDDRNQKLSTDMELTIGTEISLGNSHYVIARLTDKAVLLQTPKIEVLSGRRMRADWLPKKALVPFVSCVTNKPVPNMYDLARWFRK
jgi:hypothetical protein